MHEVIKRDLIQIVTLTKWIKATALENDGIRVALMARILIERATHIQQKALSLPLHPENSGSSQGEKSYTEDLIDALIKVCEEG
jgi:hypothetical protein